MPDDSADYMTRREVAHKFGVTSKTVYVWAHRTRPVLTELRDGDGNPRYRRPEVQRLYDSGFRGGRTPKDWRPDPLMTSGPR